MCVFDCLVVWMRWRGCACALHATRMKARSQMRGGVTYLGSLICFLPAIQANVDSLFFQICRVEDLCKSRKSDTKPKKRTKAAKVRRTITRQETVRHRNKKESRQTNPKEKAKKEKKRDAGHIYIYIASRFSYLCEVLDSSVAQNGYDCCWRVQAVCERHCRVHVHTRRATNDHCLDSS